MSRFTEEGRAKLRQLELRDYELEQQYKLKGIQANIDLLKKRGKYDDSIMLQAYLNDQMGISNDNLDRADAEQDISNLLKTNFEKTLNTNKKIGDINEAQKEVQKEKEITKKKVLLNIKEKINTRQQKEYDRKRILALNFVNDVARNKHAKLLEEGIALPKPKKAKPYVSITVPSVADYTFDTFKTDLSLRKTMIDKIENEIDNIRVGRLTDVSHLYNVLTTILDKLSKYREIILNSSEATIPERAAKKRRLVSIAMKRKDFESLNTKAKQLKIFNDYNNKHPFVPYVVKPALAVAPAPFELPPPQPPKRPIQFEKIEMLGYDEKEGHGMPRMYSLLRKQATKKGRGIAMQEVLSNFHHKPLYFNTKVKKARQIILKDEKEKLDNLINKYDILTGEILAGNNNKMLLRQLKSLITRLVNLKKLDSKVAHEVFQQLQLIK